jgi:pyrroline-5-carboxylate reductase
VNPVQKQKQLVGFVGAGNMAEAIFQGMIGAKLCESQQVLISDVREARLTELAKIYGVTPVQNNADLATQADIIILSVKPKVVAEALQSIQGFLKPDVVFVSIVAGTLISDITTVLGDLPVVRIMPNTPALINEGASGIYANVAAQPYVSDIQVLFDCVGKTVVVDNESLIDAVTAVSGSGPAYYFLLMEKMIEAAQTLGLPSDIARTLVLQTAKGAALLANRASATQGETPAQLIDKVATPGGTTEAALNAFRQGGFDQLVQTALTQAYLRNQELSRG